MGEDDPNGTPDAMIDARALPDAMPDSGPTFPEIYPTDRTQSPLTPALVDGLRAVRARGPTLADNVFMKVGDSITDSTAFLYCYDTGTVDLAGRTELQETLDFFKAGPVPAPATSPYNRDSVAATQNWRADNAIAGDPSPLTTELTTLDPRFAVVMFGTNDAPGGASTIHTYAASMLDIVDQLLAAGVVPIVSSIPPNNNNATTDTWVPKYNAVARGIAQGRQVPFVDFHREMLGLPNRGMDPDGIHPSNFSPMNCDLDATGLMKGYPMRNLLTLQALDRLRRTLVSTEAAPDAPGTPLVGMGTSTEPFRIPSLPFTHMYDSSRSTQTDLDGYPSCDTGQDEGGPEVIYQLEVTEMTEVRALVFDGAGVDLDVHILESSPAGGNCRARNDKQVTWILTPGTWYFSVDTFVPAGLDPAAGEYLFVLVRE